MIIEYRVPSDLVYGDNASLKIGSKYIPCVVAEYASLTEGEWSALKNQGYDTDMLLDKAWRISQERYNDFLINFTQLPYDQQISILENLSISHHVLAEYIAWSVIYDRFDEELLSKGKQSSVSLSSLLLTPTVKASQQGEVPSTAWGWTKWYVKEFFNREFLPTAWEGLKGLGAGVAQSLTLGLVDIEAKKDYMQVGKTIGSITTDVELTLATVGGLGKTMGIKGLNVFSRLSKSAEYKTLLGIEARYSGGIYGNIVKIAENKRFGGWYLGVGHHRLKTITLANGKRIFPGWFHFYFSTGKIATWSPRALSYVEMNLYSTAWNTFRRAAPFLLASSLIGDQSGEFKMVSSIDPNYISSSPDRYITDRNQSIFYTIHFENLENATAPAYNVRVELTLDDNLDADSVKLVSSSHPDCIEYFNVSNRNISILFKDINLPPNKNPPEGEGWFSFKVNLTRNIESGAEIIEKAKVYFDYNPPVETNEVILTFDDIPPTTTVNAKLVEDKIKITVNGSDQETGMHHINVGVIEKGSNKMRQLTMRTNETVYLQVENGKTYYIVSNGVDNAGNIEVKNKVDASIEAPPNLPLVWIIMIMVVITLISVIMTLKKKR